MKQTQERSLIFSLTPMVPDPQTGGSLVREASCVDFWRLKKRPKDQAGKRVVQGAECHERGQGQHGERGGDKSERDCSELGGEWWQREVTAYGFLRSSNLDRGARGELKPCGSRMRNQFSVSQ